MDKKLLLVLVLVFLFTLSAPGCGESASIVVPVEIKNASNIGAISFEIIYDSTVLKAIDVKTDKLASGAEAGYNAQSPGLVLVVVQNAPNINGDGTLVNINFEALKESGSTSFTFQSVQAIDLTTLDPVPTETTAGSYVVESNSLIKPVISFN